MKRCKSGQIKFGISEEMLADVVASATREGHSVSAEIRARIEAFREEHRLVSVTIRTPKGKVGPA